MKPEQLVELYQRLKSYRKVAEYFKLSETTVRRRIRAFKNGSEDVPIDELIRRRIEDFQRKKTVRENRPIVIKIPAEGPFGVAFFGDPHIDCDGTDIELLLKHVEVVRKSKYIYAGCLGDITNNWVGRLGHLYSQQSTTAKDSIRLAKYFVGLLPWLFIILGNHDCWTRPNNFLEWLDEHIDGVVKPYNVELEIQTERGSLFINASHHVNGSSVNHPAGSIAKFAARDLKSDIYVAAHTHQSGYQFGWNPVLNKYWHAVRVGSYKKFDEYADSKGLVQHPTFQCPVAIIDLKAKNPLNRVRWEWDIYEAEKRLQWMNDSK